MKLSTTGRTIVTAAIAALSVISLAGEITVASVAQAAIAGLGVLVQVKPKA